MVSMLVRSRIDCEGVLEIRVPADLPEGEVEVMLVIQPIGSEKTAGWPDSFFENTAGAWKGELERPPQGAAKDWS